MHVQLHRPLEVLGPDQRLELIALPLERQDSPEICGRHHDCGAGQRCAQGRCFAPSWSRAQLRRWYTQGQAIPGALEGWQVLEVRGHQLEIASRYTQEQDGLIALFAGRSWQDVRGERPAASLEPLAYLWRPGHGKGAWREVEPRWHAELGRVQIELPRGWTRASLGDLWAQDWAGRRLPLGVPLPCPGPAIQRQCVQLPPLSTSRGFFSQAFRLQVSTRSPLSAQLVTGWSKPRRRHAP